MCVVYHTAEAFYSSHNVQRIWRYTDTEIYTVSQNHANDIVGEHEFLGESRITGFGVSFDERSPDDAGMRSDLRVREFADNQDNKFKIQDRRYKNQIITDSY